MKSARRSLELTLLLAGIPGLLSAVELRSATLQQWDNYIRIADSQMQSRLDGRRPFLWTDESPERISRLKSGEVLIAPVADGAPADSAAEARQICDRHRGVGADGLIFATLTDAGAETELFNCDGSRAEVSGNGVRCVAAWLAHDRALRPGAQLTIGTGAGPKRLTFLESSGARATFVAMMGHPTGMAEQAFDLHGEVIRATVLSMGNPHCVVFGDLSDTRLRRIGQGLATHAAFPEGTNVELIDERVLIPERVGVGGTAPVMRMHLV